MSAFGGHEAWISFYLPVHSVFRALVSFCADPALTSPLCLAVGFGALWHIARKLVPGRPDAVLVTLLLAFSSTQLLVMSMTAYAMTAHFALNMVWLALFLRNDWKGHFGAAVVAFLAIGLHQLQFHPLFAAGFLFWIVLQRSEEHTSALQSLMRISYSVFCLKKKKYYEKKLKPKPTIEIK